jgi:hypothetical protein
MFEPMGREWLATGFVSICLTLPACGGGSGGGSNGPDPPDPPGRASIRFDADDTNFTSNRAELTTPSRLVLWVDNTTVDKLFISGTYTTATITQVDVELLDTDRIPLIIKHRPTSTLYNGDYTDTVTFNACLDQACNRPLDGSPLTIPVHFKVVGTDLATGLRGPPPDPEAASLKVLSRILLPHDVVDAEYNRSFDRIVMAATYPANALYVYDVAAGTEESVALEMRPTSISISPDGLTAAVGHDGLISIVDLAQVGQPGAPDPQLLNVSADVFDVVLDGRGRVHATPDTPEFQDQIHTVDIATGAERLSDFNGTLFGHTYARLHPAQDHLFVGNQFTSPATIGKWDITGAVPQYVNSADFDAIIFEGCANIWFDESGSQVYSQCGRVSGTDGPLNMALPDMGRLPLSGPETTSDAFTVVWLDQLAARNEITLIEANAVWCDNPGFGIVCYHRLGRFDSATLARLGIAALPPVNVDGTLHAQRGQFVFYQSDGTRKFLLSRLDAMATPEGQYYLSVLDGS